MSGQDRLKRTFRFIGVLSGAVIFMLSFSAQGFLQDSSSDSLEKVTELISRFQFGKAMKRTNEYLENHPNSGEGWYLLGYCRNRLGLYSEAHAALSQAKTLGVNTPELNRELGFSFQGQSRYRVALTYLKKASEEDGEAWLARAQIYVRLKKYDRALQAAKRVIEVDRSLKPRALFIRAYVHAKRGEIEQARREVRKGLDQFKRKEVRRTLKTLRSLLMVLDRDIMNQYFDIFVRETVDEEKGMIQRRRIDSKLKNDLSEAIEAYRSETGREELDPDGFLQFLRSSFAHDSTLKLFQDLHRLYRTFDNLDLTSSGRTKLKKMVLNSIRPKSIEARVLIQAIEQTKE